MNTKKQIKEEQPFSMVRIYNRALILPCIGLLLLTPPFARIFQIDTTIFGIPFTLLYLFVLWAILILGTALLSRKLIKDNTFKVDPPDIKPDIKPERKNN